MAESVTSITITKNIDGTDAIRLPIHDGVLSMATLVSQCPGVVGLRFFTRSDVCRPTPAGSWMVVPVGGVNNDQFHAPVGGWSWNTTYIAVTQDSVAAIGKS